MIRSTFITIQIFPLKRFFLGNGQWIMAISSPTKIPKIKYFLIVLNSLFRLMFWYFRIVYHSLEDMVLKFLILNYMKNKITNQNVPKNISKTMPCKNREDRLDGFSFVYTAICGLKKQNWKFNLAMWQMINFSLKIIVSVVQK